MAKRRTNNKPQAKPTAKSGSRLSLINFEAHKPPTFKEQKGKDWVLYGAEQQWKNNYPAFLLHLYNESSTHNAIINGKVKYISGQGWVIDKELPLEEKMRVSSFIKDAGSDSAHELLKKLALDVSLFGGFAVQPIWSKDGKKLSMNFIEFCHLRSSEGGEEYYYTKDWTARSPETNDDYKVFTPFDPDTKGENQLIYYKEYRPNLQEYPLPDYQAGINYISSDIDIATFIASNTSQGFSGGTIINLYNGEPSQEAQRRIEQQFKSKFTGAEQAGSLLLSFNDPDTNGAEVLPLADNGQDDRYNSLSADVEAKIFTSHQATSPILFGVKAEGGLSNNADEIRVASEHLQNTYITPKQNVFEDLFNYILALQGLPECLAIQDLEPIKDSLPLDKIWEVLTQDEKREMAGYAPLKTSQEFKSEDNDELDLFFEEFSKMGYLDSELEVVSEKDIHYNPFTFEVTEIDKQILNLLEKNPKITVDEIAKATGETIEQTNHRLTVLEETGEIVKTDNEIKVADEDNKENEPEEELITVYKYVKRPNVPNAKSGSREFCKRLMGTGDRNYTKEQIDKMSLRYGRNVFRKRGGWYHNPVTKVTTPYCRHVWRARTVKIKK